MRREIWAGIVSLVLSISLVAQSNFCEDFLLPTLEQVSAICGDIGRSEICYGNNFVEATFIDNSAISFSNPADIAPVPLLESLHTTALDAEAGLFGVALMQIQSSNIPNTLPGQSLTFLLMGDVTIENDVAPDEVFEPVDPIQSITTTASNIRLEPHSNSRIVWSVPRDTSLALDARNEAGDWYRVSREGQVGWISSTIIAEAVGMSELPVFRRSSRTAMQAFYFSTGIGIANCEQAPSQLIIQGPQGLETSLTINGAEVRIGSTIALSTPSNNRLRLSVLDGYAIVGQTVVPGGFSMDAVLNENRIPANAWTGFRPIPEQELGFYRETAQSVGEELMSYVPDVPTIQEIQVLERAFEPTPTPLPPTEVPTELAIVNIPNSSSGSGGGGGSTCLDSVDPGQVDLSYSSPERDSNGTFWYSTDGTCSIDWQVYMTVVRANNKASATSRCKSLSPTTVEGVDLTYYGYPAGYYLCS